eukprot:TRINITY_DN3654_c0_g3_i8.p1 TRINITY_DN3654_c0_g3~~TRINITY_DN3654_c0_g3_i8.p1  ORF type:complete len:589 (+),score=112.24 TRINITY_DN3654_c0_g3_i8:64-1767(+)
MCIRDRYQRRVHGDSISYNSQVFSMGCHASKPPKTTTSRVVKTEESVEPLSAGKDQIVNSPLNGLTPQRRTRREATVTSLTNIRQVYEFAPKAIGHGYFGTVRVAWMPSNPEARFAVKSIVKDKVKKESFVMLRELDILKSLSHPNIVKFYETYQDEKYFHIVMEYCSGGELLERVVRDGHLRESEAAKIMRKAFSAVGYLHAKGICHRDLKPENFLFSDSSIDAEIKIIDFGLARRLEGDSKSMKTVVGTALYVAPEVLHGSYDHRCDNWSLGVILYMLLCGTPPFYAESNQQIFKLVLEGKYSLEGQNWRRVSRNAKDLISKLLVQNPDERLTALEALKHPWFTQHSTERLAASVVDHSVLDRLKAYALATRFKREILRFTASTLNESELKNLKDAFKKLDLDGTGRIHVSELVFAARMCGYMTTETEVRYIVEEMSSGEAEQINHLDFLAATLDQKKFLTQEKLRSVFQYFDIDKSGFITKANLKEAMARRGRKLADDDLDEMIKFEEFYNMMVSDVAEPTADSLLLSKSGNIRTGGNLDNPLTLSGRPARTDPSLGESRRNRV